MREFTYGPEPPCALALGKDELQATDSWGRSIFNTFSPTSSAAIVSAILPASTISNVTDHPPRPMNVVEIVV